MNKIAIFSFFLLMGFGAFGQVPHNMDSSSFLVPGYGSPSAVITFQKDSLKVQRGTKAALFPLKEKAGKKVLAQAADTLKILDLLEINSGDLNRNGYHSILNLIAMAGQQKDQKLMIEDSQELTVDADSEGNSLEPADLEKIAEPDQPLWPWIGIAGIGGLLIGWVLGYIRGKKKQKAKMTSASTNDIATNSKEGMTAKSQPQTNADSKYKRELNDLVKEDNAVYGNVFKKVVLPLQDAISQNDQAKLVKQMVLASFYLSSIARVKVSKKQNFDAANVSLLLDDKEAAKAFPVIDENTPPDKIPADLRPVIRLLKEHQVKGIENVIINGYRIG